MDYWTRLYQIVDNGFTSVEGKFGLSYTCTNRKWNTFGLTTCLIYGWAVPWLTETFADASAYMPTVQQSIGDNYTGFRVIPAKKAWQMVREQVELSSGRRRPVDKGGFIVAAVVDESKPTFEQCLQKIRDIRMMDRKRRELYREAAFKFSEEKKEQERIDSHKSKVRFRKREA